VDLGDDILRDIGSGLNGKIPIDEMTSGFVVVFDNLKPRKMIDFMSCGMIMCASNEDRSIIELLRPHPDSKEGEKIELAGIPKYDLDNNSGRPIMLNPKFKIELKLMSLLRTNDKGEATYNGVNLITSGGNVKVKSLKNASIS
jgi:aminoacyl tRNA synthase complex-interacting multifunctional protein 1